MAMHGLLTSKNRRIVLRVLGFLLGAIAVSAMALLLIPSASIWGPPQRVSPARGGGLQSLSCSSSSFCATFDWAGHLYTYSDRKWSQSKLNLARNGDEPVDLSCGAAGFCMVAYGDKILQINGGITSTFIAPADQGLIVSVSCSSASFCGAVGGGEAYVYQNGRWTQYSVEDPNNGGSLNTISCSGRSFCAAGGDNGVATFNGLRWKFHRLALGSSGSFDSVTQLSCVNVLTCNGTTQDGNWLRMSAGSWFLEGSFGGGNQSQGFTPKMLSCPTISRCFLASTSGTIFELNKGHWSRLGYLSKDSIGRRLLEMSRPLKGVSISCPTVGSCLAVDGTGDAYDERTD